MAHVPQHLLSVIHSCKYRRLHSPGHLLLNALNLVLNGYPTPPLPFLFFFFFFNNTFLGLPPWKEEVLTRVLPSPQVPRVTHAP